MLLPDYRFVRCKFYAPIGAEAVRIENASVVGKWRTQPKKFYGEKEKTLAERFINSSCEVSEVISFTTRYGPLSGSYWEGVGVGFAFTLESWRLNQLEFRRLWRVVQTSPQMGPFQPLEGTTMEIRRGWLHLGCPDLWTFMTLELMSRPKKLRFCERPDCPHPYFMANHGKERYCSTDCANWAQSKWKKQWHEERRVKKLKNKR